MDILLRVVDKEVSVQIHIFVVFLNLSSKLPVLKDEVNNYTFSLCLNFFHLLARKPNLEKKNIYFYFSLVRIKYYLSRALGKWDSTKTVLFNIFSVYNSTWNNNFICWLIIYMIPVIH
jgi:hypothetical protein